MRTQWSIVIVLAALHAAIASAQPQSPLSRLAIRRERTDNGLRVVLSPDPTIPTVDTSFIAVIVVTQR